VAALPDAHVVPPLEKAISRPSGDHSGKFAADASSRTLLPSHAATLSDPPGVTYARCVPSGDQSHCGVAHGQVGKPYIPGVRIGDGQPIAVPVVQPGNSASIRRPDRP
jgi:hypothetical protein